MRTVSSDSPSKGQMSHRDLPRPHNANLWSEKLLSPSRPSLFTKAEEWGRGGVTWKCGWERRRENTMNYYCFKHKFLIYQFNVGANQIYPPPSETAGTRRLGWAQAAWCLEPSCLPPPHPKPPWLILSWVSILPHPFYHCNSITHGATKGAWKEERKREEALYLEEK